MNQSIKVYCAGKIGKNDWRHQAFPALRRNAELEDGCVVVERYPLEWPFAYVGPFFISCDHGCYHGPNSHGVGAYEDYWGGHGDHPRGCMGGNPARRQAIASSLEQIRCADVVFVWFSSPSAYGTMSEIGYAIGKDKPVWLYHPPGNEWEQPWQHECWFPIQMATVVLGVPTALEAWSHFKEAYPWDREKALRHAWGVQKASPIVVGTRQTPRAFTKGHVYFLKSGPYFKIGKATDIDRRVKQLAIQLPEKAVVWHTIRADFMDAAEAYYHAAFKDLRKNGEWFELEEKHLKWVKAKTTWEAELITGTR